MTEEAYDYVIAGGGSAGAVIAARLSEDPDVSVLLIEAGPADRHPFIHMPVGFAKMTAGPFTWGLKTAPQKHARNREIPYAQARVLGGGGSINAEIFTRGHPEDFDIWADDHGCKGWAFKDVQPWFLKCEDNDMLSGEWHGQGGPLGISTPAAQPISMAFVKAGQEMGIPYNPDFNGPSQAGIGIYQTTIRKARRCSASVAYLRPARGRKNLTVRTGCLVTRIRTEKGRAVGLETARGFVRAEREVIIASGAIGSPKLLMLSGIGEARELKRHGIKAVRDIPAVGENLQDHFGIDIVHELNGPWSLDKYNKWHWAALAGIEYVLFGKGPAASNIVEGGAFWHSAHSKGKRPDLQFHFLCGAGVEAGVPAINGSGTTLNSYTLNPKSRGSVKLRSADPLDQPIVDPNFLAEPDDLKVSTEGVRLSREIMMQPAMRKFVKAEHFPGKSVKSRKDLEDYARNFGRTSYHPVGTCRMGGDKASVVDPELRVRGIDNLTVADSSIMPRLISSNTNAASIMIGERAAHFIRSRRN